jgi:hypothetical protein
LTSFSFDFRITAAMANMDPEAKKIMEEQISALKSQIEANQRIGIDFVLDISSR